MNTIIKRRVLISMLFIGLVLMGVFSYKYIPMELYPNADLPVLYVSINAQNELDLDYVEKYAVIPVEGAIRSQQGIEKIESQYYSRGADIKVSLNQDVDLKYAFLQMEQKIKSTQSSVPEIFKLSVSKGYSGSSNDQFMHLLILGEGDIDYVRNITDEDIVPYLNSVEGMASVKARGGRQKTIEIIVDPDKCKALNITKSTISNLISNNQTGKNFIGLTYDGNKRYFANITAEYLNTEDLGNIVVAKGPILLKDIAEIRFGVKEEETYSRTKGKEVVSCVLSKSPTVNVIELSKRTRAEIDRLNEELKSKGISIEIDSDTAEIMNKNINSIIDLAISGAFLAIIVLFLFLRKIKIVSIVAFAIPISVFSSFYFFYLSGITINTLTLTGLALAVGMLLDNSIVVMENIYRLKATGMPTEEACVRGTTEVWKAILAATVTTVTVFLPFLFTNDYIIKMIGEHIGISIITTLIISLVVALLLIPMAINYLLRKETGNVNFSNISIHNRLVQMYIAILKMALRKPTEVILFSLVILFVTVVLSLTLSLNTLKEIQNDSFQVEITTPSGSTLEKTDELIRRFEEELPGIPEIKTFSSTVEKEKANLIIKLEDQFEKINGKNLQKLKADILELAKKVNITDISLDASESRNNFSGGSSLLGNSDLLRYMGRGSQSEKIVIKGEDFEKMTSYANLIDYQLKELEDVIAYSNINVLPGDPEARIYFDPYLMEVNEVTPSEVSQELTGLQPESPVSNAKFKTKDQEYDITIRDINYDKEKEEKQQYPSLEDLRNLDVTTSKKALIQLNNFSRIRLEQGQGRVKRVNQEKQLEINYMFKSDINESKDLLEASRLQIDELVQGTDVPSGVFVEIVHEEKQPEDYTFLIIAAFVLIYMILAAVFESLTAPIVLMFTIPLAAIGSLLFLLFTNNSVANNAQVYVGFIILIGIVVNNSIILIDYTTMLRKNGFRKQRAIITAGLSRLRPILITAITTIVAMIPLAMGKDESASGLGAPFAITVIGGLTMSTLLTLVIIPTLYSGLEDALKRLRTQSLFMKVLQLSLFVICVVCTFIFSSEILNRIFYLIIAVVLVPGITWFLENSLRRAKSNIIPPHEELVITIRNLVKIYGRPLRFTREWTSGLKVKERLGLKTYYYSWKDLQALVWLFPITVFLFYFTFIYQVLFFWAIVFALCSWFMTLNTIKIFYELSINREWHLTKKILEYTVMVIYYIGPLIILNWGSSKFNNSGGAVFIGLFWYLAIGARFLSNKINNENINIDLIDGRFRMLRKTIFRMAAQTPIIGAKKKPFKALSSVSLEIRTGMFGLLGPNGAGKTTLMRIICGIFEQSYGKIFINGIDTQKKREELQGLIGYLPQEFGTYENLTAWEFLEYQSLLKGIYDKRTRFNRISEVLSAVHMYENKDKKIGGFSGGMKQRIGIAQTLLNLPRILVVDEPTAGLDPRERIRFRNLLVELSRNRIVIFSTHIIEDIASSCNQVGVINKGILKYLGTPNDMANIAKDVTWSFELPARDFTKLPSDLLIVHHIRQGDVIRVRCLSEEKPAENAERILPALEDSYLWLLRTVKIQNKEEIIT